MKHFLCFTLFFLAIPSVQAQESSFGSSVGVQPEFGFVLDGVFSTHEHEGISADLQMAEMSVSSRIDPLGRAFAIFEFPSAHEIEIPEAVMIFDGLGDGYEIRAGRMLLDLGKWNTTHSHDLMTPYGDPVRAGLFGGQLRGTGLEFHKWFAAGDVPVRFSLGAWSGVEAHSHEAHAHGEEAAGEEHHGHAGIQSGHDSDRPGFAEWSYSGRLTAQGDLGANATWQLGASYLGSSQGLQAAWENELETAEGIAYGLGARTLGVDFSLRSKSLDSASWNALSIEYWNHAQDHAHAEGGALSPEIERAEPQGAWLTAEHGLSESWSTGAHVGWWEAEHEEAMESNYRYGVTLNRHFSEFNRLRLALEQVEHGDGDSEWIASFQWSLFMGKHRHGLDW